MVIGLEKPCMPVVKTSKTKIKSFST